MSTRKTQIPAIPPVDASSPQALDRTLNAMREAIEVGLTRRGDPLDGFVSRRELEAIGLVKVKGGQVSSVGSAIGGDGDSGTVTPGGDDPFGTLDPTIPPMPTGLRASALSQSSIGLTWDTPNYPNHRYTEIWVAESDGSGEWTLDRMLADNDAFTTAFQRHLPQGIGNLHQHFLDTSFSTLYVHQGITPRAEPGSGTPLEAALNPAGKYYWIRFISFAGVAGPFAPAGVGVSGRVMLDPAAILDAMTEEVINTPLYNRLSRILHIPEDIRAQLFANPATPNSGALTRFLHDNTQAVREDLLGLQGSVFGTDDEYQEFLALNQTLNSIVQNVDGSIDQLWTVRMQNTVGGRTYAAGFGLGVRYDNEDGTFESDFIVSAGRFSIMSPIEENGLEEVEPVIPFIVNTTTSPPTIGIKGTLVVNGLITATRAEFGHLTSETGFVQHMTSQTMRANLVVGNRIIAGLGVDPTTGEPLPDNGNWRVELNAISQGPPIRYWKPGSATQSPQEAFVLESDGNVRITSFGGNVAQIGGSDFALWLGDANKYNQGPTETNATFAVTHNGRVLVPDHSRLYVGNNPISLASGTGSITVLPRRDGGTSSVFVSTSGALVQSDGGEFADCSYMVNLYLTAGGNGGVSFSGAGGTFYVAGSAVNSRNGAMNVKNFSLSGIAQGVPAGRYDALLSFTPWRGNDKDHYVVVGPNFLCMQINYSD